MSVRLMDDETERIEGFAEALEIPDILQGDKIREVDGACAFLGDDQLCRIHARWGMAAKPRVCQQYPVIAVRAEETLRMGLDPGCLTQWSSWRDGPEVQVDGAITTPTSLPPAFQEMEEGLLALCAAPDVTVARLLGTLTREEPVGDALPAGFASRWAELMLRAPLVASLARYGQSQVFHRELSWLLSELDQSLDPKSPPPWPVLSPEADAYAVEVTRRMLFLRLGHKRGPPPTVALITLGGAVSCAWVLGDDADRWAAAFAVWCRVIRSPVFWETLLPKPEVLRWVALGGELE